MKIRSLAVLLLAVIGLVACADMNTLQSRKFSRELGKQYSQISVNDEVSDYKWSDKEHFSKKSERAYKMVDVQPEQPTNWNVPHEYRPELKNAYDMLQIALIPDRKKVEKPLAAADAQVYFDCWVEQSHKHWVPNAHENDCRAAFYESFCRMYNGKCTSAIGRDHIFRLYFSAHQSIITPKGETVIDKIITTYHNGGKEIIVAGHSDRVGTPAEALKISFARANAVKAKLVFAGIPERKITVKAFGDRLLLVPTPKNTPNASNRRVLVVVR
jgi:outer membrane protein OmpA-like peptidoglycan-associated protein